MSALVKNAMKIEGIDLTQTQKKFNRLTKGLQRAKQSLIAWQAVYEQVKARYLQELYPLMQEIDQFRLKMLVYLDEIYQAGQLNKTQQKKLLNVIKTMAESCIGFDRSGQAEAIYDKHHDNSYGEVKEALFDEMREDFKEMLDIDLGEDFDFESADALEKFMGKLAEKKEEASEKENLESKLKKSKKESKKQHEIKQASAETKAIDLESGSLQEVFRRLARVLHPDREQDEKEKIKKSELMQRANIAYKNKDLLSLLELQIEIEQAEQSDINNMTEEKLQTYNKLLQKQNNQLKEELTVIKHRMSIEFNMPMYFNKGAEVFYYFDLEKKSLLENKKEIIRDLEAFQDIKQLKAWLNIFKPAAYQF